MHKTELETIALDCLERLDNEAKAARQRQDEKIQDFENRLNDYEQHLTRLSELYQNLQPLVRSLDSALSRIGKE